MMTCEIIDQASTRHAAIYCVRTRGRIYEARLEDPPGADDCTVHIDGLECGPVFKAIEAVVLRDWLGIEIEPAELDARAKRRRLAQPSYGKIGPVLSA